MGQITTRTSIHPYSTIDINKDAGLKNKQNDHIAYQKNRNHPATLSLSTSTQTTMSNPPGLAETYDHNGKPVTHHRTRVNGIRLHYITAGSGPPLLLLHGTPKNSFYWYRIFPLLTPHFTLVAPDLRGFGYTDKPPATEGYDSWTNAQDMAELMTQ
jgi:hypothetical protein